MPTINWTEIYNRLEAVNKAIESGFSQSGEERAVILKKRAEALARESEEKTAEGEYIEVVEFVLAYERYAIQTSYVREIIVLNELIRIPCTPLFTAGIINLRGEIISVIDLKRFFDLPAKGISYLNKVIILHNEEMEFGILADSITGVRNLNMNEIEPKLPTLTGIREEYLKGITRDQVVFIDAEKLLTDKKMIIDETV
ncbi:MAG: purine-binding chemotaxis protein CheW [Nitrospirae bacterium]|nr:purine-binding chemotaxis protein CheW [Nitrospirota bacterium]